MNEDADEPADQHQYIEDQADLDERSEADRKRKSKSELIFTTILSLTLYRTIPTFNNHIKPIENMVGKGENAGYQHFLPFPPYFLPFPKQSIHVCLLNDVTST